MQEEFCEHKCTDVCAFHGSGNQEEIDKKLINVTKGRENDVQQVELWDSQELPVAYLSNFYVLKNKYCVNCTEWTFVHLMADLRSEMSVGFYLG